MIVQYLSHVEFLPTHYDLLQPSSIMCGHLTLVASDSLLFLAEG